MVRKQIINMCLGSLLMLGFSTSVFAETTSKVVNVSEILKRLHAAAYTTVFEVELEDKTYDIKTVNDKGQKIKLRIDATTGKIPAQDKNAKTSGLTMLQAAEKVEAAGYVIHKIESEKNNYEIKAIDSKGKKVQLKVDADTGKINTDKEWF